MKQREGHGQIPRLAAGHCSMQRSPCGHHAGPGNYTAQAETVIKPSGIRSLPHKPAHKGLVRAISGANATHQTLLQTAN